MERKRLAARGFSRSKCALSCETLERRCLFAVTWSLEEGLLEVIGTSNSDYLWIGSDTGGYVWVDDNGTRLQPFDKPSSAVTKIVVTLDGSNDSLTFSGLPYYTNLTLTSLFGGFGDDTIYGTRIGDCILGDYGLGRKFCNST